MYLFFYIFFMNTSAPRIPIPVCWHHFSFFLRDFDTFIFMTVVYLLPSIFLSFFERTQKIMHIYYSLTPLSPKKKRSEWEEREKKTSETFYFFSSILLFCNTYLEFLFLRLLTHFIIKISKSIRNMQWMVIYKHDKENKIGRGNCTACSAAILFINSDSSAPALIYFWWYKQDDFAVWYIFKFEYSR